MYSSTSRFSTPHQVTNTQLHSSYHDDDSDDDWDPRIEPAKSFQQPRPAVNNVSKFESNAHLPSEGEKNEGADPYIIGSGNMSHDGRLSGAASASSPFGQQRSASGAPKSATLPKYPTVDENQLRKQCQDTIQQKSPMILVQRLLADDFLLWEELSLLEKRLVDYNPRFFELTIDLPECKGRRVKLLRRPYAEQLDVDGAKGGLRCALDEDISWLPDSKLAFSLDPSSPFRECAIISFVPPRCFIMCDKEAAENEERSLSISDGLRAYYAKTTVAEVEIRPGVALVGLRDDIFMRVIVLEPDVHKPMKVRCACMDHSAIYSFGRSDLFPLPDEFSPKNVPVSIFLGRFRGTHYVYKEKYQEVNDAMCQPNKDEGYVTAVTCALYGPAPDGLIIVDAAMPDNGWVSSVMVRSTIAAPMKNDLPIMFTTAQAEEAIQEQRTKKTQSSSEEQGVPSVEAKSQHMVTESCAEIAEDVAESVKSECDLPTIKEDEKMDELSVIEQWSRKESICSRENSDAEAKNETEEGLGILRKQEEEPKLLEEKEMQLNLLTASETSEKSEEQDRDSSLWHRTDESAEAYRNFNTEEQTSSVVSTFSEASEQEAKEGHRDFTEQTSPQFVKGSENENGPESDKVADQHPPPLVRPALLHADVVEAKVLENDVIIENLRRALDAYIIARRQSKASPSRAAAIDFSVFFSLEVASRLHIGDNSAAAGADNLRALADMIYGNFLDTKEKV